MNPDRASATARLIAAATVMSACEGDLDHGPPTGAADWCALFLSTRRQDRWLLWSTSLAPGRCWWRFMESITIPGIVNHWMARKRQIDRLVRQSADERYSQLIVIGAGLDALACRMSCLGTFSQIMSADHCATLALVKSALGRSSNSTPKLPSSACLDSKVPDPQISEIDWVEMDLVQCDPTEVIMSSQNFDPARSAVIVLEGVLMYLSPARVGEVLDSLSQLPVPAVRLIASWMVAEPGQPIGFRGQSGFVGAWLRRQGEPMLWGSCPADLPDFLSRHGWPKSRQVDLTQADIATNKHHRRGVGLPSERLFIAEKK